MEKDILMILQEQVKKIEKEKGYSKNYGRKFYVSMLQEFDKDNKLTVAILLNVKTKGTSCNFSRKIFPKNNKDDMVYGLPSLEEEMKYLFNTTM